MDELFFVDPDRAVFIYARVPDQPKEWRFSRMSPMQQSKVVLMLRQTPEGGWALQDHSPGKRGTTFGTPWPSTEESERSKDASPRDSPPLGRWKVWNTVFMLMDHEPCFPPLEQPVFFEKPFASLRYYETGNIGRCHLTMHSAPITDQDLEDILGRVRDLLQNLARRPRMIVVFRSDARKAALPAMRHVWRFTSFIQEFGSEFFLVGRGSCFVMKSTSVIGAALISIVKMVQKLLPAPWPETIVSTLEAGDSWQESILDALPGTAATGEQPQQKGSLDPDVGVGQNVKTVPYGGGDCNGSNASSSHGTTAELGDGKSDEVPSPPSSASGPSSGMEEHFHRPVFSRGCADEAFQAGPHTACHFSEYDTNSLLIESVIDTDRVTPALSGGSFCCGCQTTGEIRT